MTSRARGTAAALAVLTALLLAAPPAHAGSPASVYTNTIAEQRADGQIYKHTDGYHDFTATVPEYNRLVLRRATTIQGLATAPGTVIWTQHATGAMANHIWAPEIHFIDGTWYVYFAAGSSTDQWRIRSYVLRAPAPTPLPPPGRRRARSPPRWTPSPSTRRRQGLPQLLGLRDRPQPLPRPAPRSRVRGPAGPGVLDEEPHPGLHQQRRHRRVRPRPQPVHRLRGRQERHPSVSTTLDRADATFGRQ